MAIAISYPHLPRPRSVPSLPYSQTLTLTLRRRRSLPLFSPRSKPSSSSPVQRSHLRSLPLSQIEPFVVSEWEPILKGWICSAMAVYCLSRTVPCVGHLPSVLCEIGSDRMVSEGLRLAALAGARSAAAYLQHAFLWEAALRSAYGIRVHIFDRVLMRDLGFFEGSGSVPTGDVAFRITSEASDVADTVYALLNTIVPTTLQLIAMVSQMVMISPTLSLIALMVIPCMSLVVAHLGVRLHEISNKAHSSVAKLSAYLNEVLPSMLAVKANNGEIKESSRFKKLAFDELVLNLSKKKMKALIPQAIRAIYIGGLLMLCAGLLVVSRNSVDASNFLSFLTAVALLIEPIQDVGKAYNELKQGEPAIERLFDLTRFTCKVVTENPQAFDLETVRGDIKFCGVTFRYGDDMPPILDNLNLHIRPGETVAVVGPSGGGKTTLAKLLLRLYDPHSGRILLDDYDVQDIRLECLRRHIALVLQDSMLFSGTVAENIGYRDPTGTVDMARIENAAKIANADDFIKDFPEGYETNIGQRGSLLSGGQKQRLAIARALYQNSSVLVLDEATSALDSRSELLVRQALERVTANRTVLIIAHRLETILMADRVVILEGGNLQEVPKSALLAQVGRSASPELTDLIV
ncbi:ABC transporter B family member 29, chloroplastic [Ananas comosus]|uniref:ABC transporter B family member 29, chloroplastic n=1 Tax=Ananas comosus TaxID=4615 RepID=A0A199V9W8_ANACO|nr:ABC transporter B family member 29, chloroplastic [Ananas comosus]